MVKEWAFKLMETASQEKHSGRFPLGRLGVPLAALLMTICCTVPAQARSNFSRTITNHYNKSAQSYKTCKHDAFLALRSQKINQETFEREILACRDRFPGLQQLQECKKRIPKNQGPAATKDALAQCHQSFAKNSLPNGQLLPMTISPNHLVFAGVGLNQPQSVKTLELPNFDCSGLRQGDKSTEYLPFGENPLNFSDFPKKLFEKWQRKLQKGKTKDSSKSHIIRGLGEILLDQQQVLLFLGTKACVWTEELPNHFKGINIYYLLGKNEEEAYPYFAVAFYRDGDRAKVLVSELLRQLNLQARNATETKSPKGNKTYLASSHLDRFDSEGDPRDLCQTPRKYPWLVVIRSDDKDNRNADFVMLANIDNMCRLGDLRIHQFLSSRSAKSEE